MALNTAPIIAADGTINVEDGAALVYTASYEEGDGAVSGMKHDDMSTEIFYDRSDIFAVRKIKQEPVSVSFSVILTEVSDGTEMTFMDAMLKYNAWSGATSVLAAAGDAWALKLTITLDSSAAGAGGEAGQTIVINHFIPEDVSFSEGTPGKVSVSGMGIPLGATPAYVLT